MKPVLLVDFGSTNTKATAVDVENCEILGTAAAYTTVETDINNGLHDAIQVLEKTTGHLEFSETYACSSAAGLRPRPPERRLWERAQRYGRLIPFS